MTAREDLVGWWALQRWEQQYDDGRVVAPFGPSPIGRLTYSASGDFAVILSRPNRDRFSDGLQWQAPADEKARAYDGMLAYYGSFEFDGQAVSHHVESSLFPNWEGGVQVRQVRLEGDVLELSAKLEQGTSEARTALLGWRRMEA